MKRNHKTMNQPCSGAAGSAATAGDDENLVLRVSPWKNVDEFKMVYNGLFDENANFETRKNAYERMIIWKIRRMNYTPASILSTMAIVEVQLKDPEMMMNEKRRDSFDFIALKKQKTSSNDDLRHLYASSFTRFLNFMSSIMQTRQFKSMYSTVKTLGLESYLVDIRHLCAHGQRMPTLEVFQRTSVYCLKWLKTYYWERELNVIENATVHDVRNQTLIEFEDTIERLLTIYDYVTESLFNKCQFISDCIPIFGKLSDAMKLLERYAKEKNTVRLVTIAQHVVYDLAMVTSEQQTRIRGIDRLFCDVLFRCKYFMKTAAKYTNSRDKQQQLQQQQQKDVTNENQNSKSAFIQIHQELFRSIVICGFIELCFHLLIGICENENETETSSEDERRNGASFWANEILNGFIIMKNFKETYKQKLEQNKIIINLDLEMKPSIGIDGMSKEIRAIYKTMGINCLDHLIFGDTIHRPWTLSFTSAYVKRRLLKFNKYTVDVIKKMLNLIDEPTFTGQQIKHVHKLLDIFTGNESQNNHNNDDKNKIYTIEDFINEKDRMMSGNSNELIYGSVNEDGEKHYGIWTKSSDNFNWKMCPIGRQTTE